MNPIIFNTNKFPTIGILIKESAYGYNQMLQHYGSKIDEGVICYKLPYPTTNKLTAQYAKDALNYLLPELKIDSIETLYVADAQYFKTLTKQIKTEMLYGDVLPCKIPGYENMNVILGVNYQALFHNPALKQKLDLSIKTLNEYVSGSFSKIGESIIHSAQYPQTTEDIVEALRSLLEAPRLTCDIETFGLDLDTADIATIAFATDQHNGIAFDVSYTDPKVGIIRKEILKDFFESYEGELIFHNASFDVRNIIYRCFMEHPLDIESMIHGLDVMYRNLHDTKIMAYLCTNSTAKESLSLKDQAFEFAGNYAIEEINNVRAVELPKLLEYNLIDTLSTWYVCNKYEKKLVDENQKDIYLSLFIPALKNITNMELVGMPMDGATVQQVKDKLEEINATNLKILEESSVIKEYEWQVQIEAFKKRNAELKRKIKPIEDFEQRFNPSSNTQLAGLLYGHLKFPITETTDSGQPATGKNVLLGLFNKLLKDYNISENDL